MIPNNIYYRRIAQILNNTEYEHFYSTLYYMKRIAMSFGKTYTGFNPSNKYLKDWAIAREVTDDGEHHINRYWLHKIALTYDNSTLAGKTDNYYLKKIYDRLNESPVASTIKIYIDNVEVDPSVEQPVKILSKANDDSVTYKLEVLDNQGNPYEGYSIPLSVGGVAVTPTPVTNAEGIVEYTYHSQGVGDTNISINCTLVSKTYSIIDAWKYIPNPTACTNCNISLPSKASISYRMSKPRIDGAYGGISLELIDSSHTYFVGNWASNGMNGLLIRNTGSSSNLVNQTCSDFSANTEVVLGVSYNNGSWTVFKDDEVQSVTANYTPTTLNIIRIQQGTMKDLIIKPL